MSTHPYGMGGGGEYSPSDTWDTTGYGQQACGTHHTRMHYFGFSLYVIFSCTYVTYQVF